MSNSGGKVNFKFLILSGLCGVGAVVAFIYYLISGISQLTSSMIMADLPGTMEIELSESGSYTVFHEWTHPFPADVTVGGDEDARAMELTLTDASGGAVSLSRSGTNSTYQMGSREGYSLYAFEIEAPGTYTLAGSYADSSEARVMYTLANNFTGKILFLVMMCFACLFVPGILGIIFLVLALKPLYKKEPFDR